MGDFGSFWPFVGIFGENGVHSWPPRESKSAEKTVHNPSGVISEVLPRVDLGPRHTSGLLAADSGAPSGTSTKIIEAQDKKRAKKGYPLFEVILGHFGGFPVKTVCTPGLQGNPCQQRKRHTTHRGHLRGPPEGQFGP